MSKEINVDGYRLAHTMIRVRNLEASFNFYESFKKNRLSRWPFY